MSKWESVQIKRAVKIHADANTQENGMAFYFTPAQARLVYWGMHCFNQAVIASVQDCECGADYADDIRCHADAYEWSRKLITSLVKHAEQKGPVIVQEGGACH